MDTLHFAFFILLVVLVFFEADSRRPSRRRRARNAKEGTIRLVGGKNTREGNVEIFHLGIWGSICDDEWDITEANIACKILGFAKATRATSNSEFGKGKKKIWMDNLYCQGHEKSFQECRFDGWGIHDCAGSEAAGVECELAKNDTKLESLVAKKPAIIRSKLKEKDIEVRLLGGRYPSEGRVEVKIDGKWGLVCGDGWSLLEATVVCQQAGKGYGQAAVQSSFFGGHLDNITISGLKCTGREQNISECSYESMGSRVSCPGPDDNIAGVICAAGYLYEQRRLLRFTARIGNIGTIDFRPFLPKHAWQWHMCHLHYHSMEVFAHFDIINLQGQKVAEGHKASFCLEDNNCLPGVEKKYACANYGDQGISVGCSDTYLHTVDCQWVDITDLAPGVYRFKVSINPEFKVAELNYDNNAAVCNLYYNAVSVRVFNCTLQRP
ncbi:lysyl oxidase homolog 3 [Trichonephila inaurata madagascariensis]|uniref:protein-lysine 6-oxidase n=1 Tax=Trichonephila inaurata madagascariensis TaxID=2747483 RepID=A0A8X6YNG8_9ARAC|nr:lysyl oxidase homolog 3 [Trichonephila inaurata madagascariensis]